MSEFVDYLSLCQQRINAYLGTQLNTPQPRLERLYSAMRYSVVGLCQLRGPGWSGRTG